VRLARSRYQYAPLVLCATKAYWGAKVQLLCFLSSVSFRPLHSSCVCGLQPPWTVCSLSGIEPCYDRRCRDEKGDNVTSSSLTHPISVLFVPMATRTALIERRKQQKSRLCWCDSVAEASCGGSRRVTTPFSLTGLRIVSQILHAARLSDVFT
jgi:hypothetical protein